MNNYFLGDFEVKNYPDTGDHLFLISDGMPYKIPIGNMSAEANWQDILNKPFDTYDSDFFTLNISSENNEISRRLTVKAEYMNSKIDDKLTKFKDGELDNIIRLKINDFRENELDNIIDLHIDDFKNSELTELITNQINSDFRSDAGINLGENTTATGQYSLSAGAGSAANGSFSVALGGGCNANGSNSHAEGGGSTAEGNNSFAFGAGVKSIGNYSMAFGGGSISKGSYSFAFGGGCDAEKDNSFAFGSGSKANGGYSFAGGGGSTSEGDYAFSYGCYVLTTKPCEAAFGKYNNSNEKTLFSIGVGTSADDRKNIFEIDDDGNVYASKFIGETEAAGLDFTALSNAITGGVQNGISITADSENELFNFNITGLPEIKIDNEGYWTINGLRGENPARAQGEKGDSGFTPIITAAKTESGTEITITNEDGSQTVILNNGITPHIDSLNNHWFIGDTDTGVCAKGEVTADEFNELKGMIGSLNTTLENILNGGDNA